MGMTDDFETAIEEGATLVPRGPRDLRRARLIVVLQRPGQGVMLSVASEGP
jgi:hypothetical protein